jgi:hypothetical protein
VARSGFEVRFILDALGDDDGIDVMREGDECGDGGARCDDDARRLQKTDCPPMHTRNGDKETPVIVRESSRVRNTVVPTAPCARS